MFTKRQLSVMALCALFGAAAPTWAQAQSPSQIATKSNSIGSSFEVNELKDGTYIRIKGSSVPTFSVFKMSDPPRLFVDISNSALEGRNSVKTVGNGVISHVALVGVRNNAQGTSRVIIGFDQAAHYDVRADGNDVLIFIDGKKRHKTAPASSLKIARADKKAAEAMASLSKTQRALELKQQQVEALRGEIAATRGNKRRDLQGKLKTLEAQTNQAQAQVKMAQAQALQSKRQTLTATQDAQRARLDAKLARQQAAQADAQRASAVETAQTQSLQKKALAAKLAKVDAQAKQASERLALQNAAMDRTKARVAKLEAQLVKARAQASKGNVNATSKLQELELARLNTTKTLEQERAQRNAAQQAYDLSKTQLGTLERTLKTRDQELAALRVKFAEVERQRITKASKPAAKAVPVDAASPNLVRDIRLESRDGRSRIVVELDRPSRFETVPGRDSRAVMILNNVKLPKQLERTLASKAQSGAVRFVSSFIDGSQVRMEAELSKPSAETISHQGNTLVWEFAPVVAPTQELAQAPVEQAPAEVAPQAPTQGESFTSAPPQVVTDPTKVNRVRGMSRKRLTIDLRDADIQNVLRLVAKEGSVNIIAGDDVKGTVTMRLRSVPLEEVFLTILQSSSLGFEMRGNVIRVAPQETLLKEQGARAAARESRRARTPLEVFLMPISYATARDLVPQVQGLLSSRGNVTVDVRTNTLIIKDITENLDSIRTLVESLDSQVPQVLIEARIVETTSTFTQQLGIQWGGGFNASQALGNPTGLIFPGVIGLSGGSDDAQTPTSGLATNQPNFAVNLPAPVGTGSGGGVGLTLGSAGGSTVLNVRLTALESAGQAKIISSPKILTLDNRQATISQGTSIPISVVSAAGVQTVFVDATLELTVTPHVTPDGNIQLQIRATKNEPDFQNTGARGDPTIIRRQAQTELLIKDGDTTVIGGIYTRNSGTSISAVPFFHKIPILGFFFKTSSESERRNELLIFITPTIVNRTESIGAGSAGRVTGSGSSSSPAAAKAPAK